MMTILIMNMTSMLVIPMISTSNEYNNHNAGKYDSHDINDNDNATIISSNYDNDT